MADWETTEGDGKTISGQATQTVDGVTTALDDMTGWTTPEVLLKPFSGAVVVVDCDLDTATATFSLALDGLAEYPAIGDYRVKFRALDPTGKPHTFPEDAWKNLKIMAGENA